MSLDRHQLARHGEDLAAAHLSAIGYQLLERNWRVRGGEVDIIALDGDCLVFVEVKTRTVRAFPPAESVDGRKQRRIHVLAQHYMRLHGWRGHRCRFDVMAVRMRRAPPHAAQVEHLQSAF